MSDLIEQLKELAPVFVLAPTARNGVTLIQRLLNSSRQIIVYGENNDFLDRLPSFAHCATQTHIDMNQSAAASRAKFLAGQSEYWSSDLWPDTAAFMNLAHETFYRAVLYYQQSSESYGFNRWGLKSPIPPTSSAQVIERLHALLPQAKFIFIYRNLFDVARSAKARQFIQNSADLARLASQWEQTLRVVLEAQWAHVLTVQYESFIAKPEPDISRIEQFTAISGIDRSVMQRKINTFAGPSQQGMSPDGYIKPANLNQAESTVLRSHAAAALKMVGYKDCA